jgi:hypothetical protein
VDVVSAAVNPAVGVDPVFKTDAITVFTWVAPNGPTVIPPGPVPNPVNKPVATIDPSKCKGSDGNYHSVEFVERKSA